MDYKLTFEQFKERFQLRLDRQQEEAVKQVDGYNMILAVPGSGKTTVLVCRIGYMIYVLGIKPEEILTVTYTVSATEDMRNRFEKFFGAEYVNRLEFRTINGISQKILTYYGVATGKTPYNVADKEIGAIINESIMKVNGGFPTDNDISNVQMAISYAKNMMLSGDQIQKQNVEIDNFADIYRVYNMLLKQRQLIDYDDQMVYALKLLQSVPEVLQYFQDRYSYFCVDEAQDTSKIQHAIMDLLSAKSGNLFLVGDEDQSIYGFRAAYPKALVDFEKYHKDATVKLLETNYRSGREIVAASELTIKRNEIRHDKRLVPARTDGGKVSRLDTSNRKSQYQYIADMVSSVDRQTAVLYRNNESALPLIDILERNGVTYRLKSSEIGFFSHPVINDLRDFLRLAINPSDDEAFMRIYYKMGVGISKVLAQGAVYNCGSEGILMYISSQNSISEGMKKRIISLAKDFDKISREKATSALDRILDKMGYRKYMDSRSMDFGKIDILRMLSLQVRDLQDLFSRLDILADVMSAGNKNYDASLVLSTIHSSKGLEYDRVYMLDMVEGVLPSVKKPGRYASFEEKNAYEEERRLYYVGMTRAREELYIFTFDYETTSQFSRELFSMKQPATTSYFDLGNKSIMQTNYGKARPKERL